MERNARATDLNLGAISRACSTEMSISDEVESRPTACESTSATSAWLFASWGSVGGLGIGYSWIGSSVRGSSFAS